VNDTTAVTSLIHSRELLLVDNEPGETLLAKEALRASGAQFVMTTVASGWEALSWLSERADRVSGAEPVLVLLDLNMPVWDGETTLKHIRSDPKIAKMPVVILTTSNSEPDVDRAHNAGANGYVWKPLNFADFTKFFAELDTFWFDHIAVTVPLVED